MKRSIALCIAVMALTLGGCASNSDIRRLEDKIADVRSTADQALNESRSARMAADDANARAKRAEEMVNRSFQKSMYK